MVQNQIGSLWDTIPNELQEYILELKYKIEEKEEQREYEEACITLQDIHTTDRYYNYDWANTNASPIKYIYI